MDNFETPYDEEAEFIECAKEDVLVAAGQTVRQHTVPVFEGIIQYLDYMKLDEPIIGLSYLDEEPCNDPQGGPRYTCRLCHQTANLAETVRHVIGRKHRQKYVELKRPDLVTWDKQSIITQGGKIIRARAEIIERQDGRGSPVVLKKGMEGKLNTTKVPPWQKQNRSISHSLSQRDVPSHLPPLMDYQKEFSHQGRLPLGNTNKPPFHPEDPYMLNRDRQMHREDTLSRDLMDEEQGRKDFRESDMYRRDYMDPDYRRKYEEEYVEDPQRRDAFQSSGVPRYDSRADMPRGQAQHAEYYPEQAPPHRKANPERDLLKEFYSEEVRRGQGHSAEYQSSQPVYGGEGDNRQWSLDRQSGPHDGMTRAGRQGSSEPEAKRRSFPTPMKSDQPHDHLFNAIRDYCHEMREPQQDVASSGLSRTGLPNSQRQIEVTRAIPDIPEPFRRFLKGANDEGQGKRKRKSRFSDATAEEVETTKDMFNDVYGPPNPKFGSDPRPVSAPLRPEIHGIQHPDRYTEPQGVLHTESYQHEGSESTGVFDMLKNIEIENAEEANFLKNKLCELLKEFKARKAEKAAQNSHSRAVISNDYNNSKPDPVLSPRPYEAIPKADSDLRRPEDFYFQDDQRGRSWKQQEHVPNERLQGYRDPVCGEPRYPSPNSNRSRYEEVFRPEMSLTPHATHPDKPARYPERFQEPMHTPDYRPAPEEFAGTRSSAPPLHMERGPSMDRSTRYSRNLDKITSTLLELVSRK
ncbi:uncharacterized protein si:ch211-13c6.2 isoform X2 [Larimichthys crocea]|uniref:uncharacterized protein si:ch211-13c6.2 isoform X2 n=1 Tax=Larimichthys crocea TaxID=215358 RepID=UPI000900E7CD|nr:uncharacterized protein LOC104922577 isoform X2 [Larimichthys crocea]